jgi:hypothetical protein
MHWTDKKLCKKAENAYMKQKNGLPLEDSDHDGLAWINTDYASSRIAQIEIRMGDFLLDSSTPVLPQQQDLYRFKNGKTAKWLSPPVKPHVLEKVSGDGADKVLRSMSTPFAVLPNELSEFVLHRVAHTEFMFGYAAAYIIRETWGRNICDLPPVDNKLKPNLNAWSERWFRTAQLCLYCRDQLSEPELRRFLRSWDWLDAITGDYRRAFLVGVYSKGGESISKERGANDIRNHAIALEQGINPVDKTSEPSLHRLVEISLKLVIGDKFRKNLWQPYIESLRNWANTVDDSPFVIAVHQAPSGKTAREYRGKKKPLKG